MAHRVETDLDFGSASRITNLPAPAADGDAARSGDLAWVGLGRWEGTSTAFLAADNIFDDSLYSSYRIVGRMIPASDAVGFIIVLRDATPADVAGGIRAGGAYARLDAAGYGTVGFSSGIAGNIGNGAGEGVLAFSMTLHMRDGERHPFEAWNISVQSNSARYSSAYSGEFIDTTLRQGIKFYFSSGNIASGWFEVMGQRKQSA